VSGCSTRRQRHGLIRFEAWREPGVWARRPHARMVAANPGAIRAGVHARETMLRYPVGARPPMRSLAVKRKAAAVSWAGMDAYRRFEFFAAFVGVVPGHD